MRSVPVKEESFHWGRREMSISSPDLEGDMEVRVSNPQQDCEYTYITIADAKRLRKTLKRFVKDWEERQ